MSIRLFLLSIYMFPLYLVPKILKAADIIVGECKYESTHPALFKHLPHVFIGRKSPCRAPRFYGLSIFMSQQKQSGEQLHLDLGHPQKCK